MADIPSTQHAVQLVGPGELRLNTEKPVIRPTGHQILCQIEATGLCFSDLKLLKQFTDHARKGEVVEHIDAGVLQGIPSYVPGDKPTVPGHETVVRIVEIGDLVRNHRVGERCLVQTDYRVLRTEGGSNAAFGYNFEGGLQEYVIIDERVSADPLTDERFLIPVGAESSASAICLVEPWACVEDSYANIERRTIKAGGRLLVVVDQGRAVIGLKESLAPEGLPAKITIACRDFAQIETVGALGVSASRTEHIESLPDHAFDDIVYFGSDKTTIEILNSKIDARGIVNVITAGKRIGEPVSIGVGRIHYGMTRWIGTTSDNAAEGYRMIPPTGELRAGDRCVVIGAGGPMGQMHTIRNVCVDLADIRIAATDVDDERLESLRQKAAPMAAERGVELRIVNTAKTPLEGETFTYTALMVPVAQFVSDAIAQSAPGALVNIFAGIPASTIHVIGLDAVIEKRVFLFGTSGSVLRDMKIVLDKVERGTLDTNCSVDAVSGIAGAIDGIAAVENRALAGKIIVYPSLRKTGLIPIHDLEKKFPSVAAQMKNGQWTGEAEAELLRVAK
ncbi:alcohol dehydrogenase catalytic domain-containing protein [Candidatus Sumerlaeota bacterium]|nr:alcohol dehydrogenase catalytic domain-containing protein [Candidatus Sumerlaeota bacterium]